MRITLNWHRHDSSLFAVLQEHNIELDQRLADAAIHNPPSMTAYLQSTQAEWYDKLPPLDAPALGERIPLEDFRGMGTFCGFVDLGVQGIRNSTFGTRDYLRGLLLHAREYPGTTTRSPVLDRIAAHFGAKERDLRLIPEVQGILAQIEQCVDGSEDYPYLFFYDGKKLRVRTASVLGDYVQENDSGLFVPQRALLTHLDEIGFFTTDAIEELEDLIKRRPRHRGRPAEVLREASRLPQTVGPPTSIPARLFDERKRGAFDPRLSTYQPGDAESNSGRAETSDPEKANSKTPAESSSLC